MNNNNNTLTTMARPAFSLRNLGLACSIALLGACASGPKGPSPELARLLSEVDRLEGDTRIAANADAEIRRADAAVQRLLENERRMDPDDRDQALYVADKLVQIAESEGMGRYAESRGLELGRERERLLVEARTRQLNQARGETAEARLAAEDARARAARESYDAEQARNTARSALSEAERAKLAAADSEDIARMERENAIAAQNSESSARLQAELAQTDAQKARQAAAQAEAERAQAVALSSEAQAELEQLRAQMAELQTKTTERGLVVTLGDVLFELDRAELKPGGQRTLDKLATAIQSDDDVQLVVEGHTDSTGSRDYNMDLSKRRAATVAQYLQSHGVAAERIQSAGLGPDFPVAVNTTEAGRQQNRRVEVVLRNAVALSQTN